MIGIRTRRDKGPLKGGSVSWKFANSITNAARSFQVSLRCEIAATQSNGERDVMEVLSTVVTGPFGVLAGVIVGIVLSVIALRVFVARPMRERRQDADEQMLKRKVAEKAALRSQEFGVVEDENLTDSGIFSVLEMMDALVSGGNFEEAEKWALNAIHNHPKRTDVPMKLAEIYYRTGRKTAFLAVVGNLTSKGLDVPAAAWADLVRMGTELAPEENAIIRLQERIAPDLPVRVH